MPDRKTVTVQRANVILRVPEEWADRYIEQGYNVIDSYGNVIQESIPKDLGTLQKAYIEHTQKIKELEEVVQQLTVKKSGRPKK